MNIRPLANIGDLYRPKDKDIQPLKDKRGLVITQKMRSHFGKKLQFIQEIYLHEENGYETIHMDFTGLEMPIVVLSKTFSITDEQHAVSHNPPYEVNPIWERQLLRPQTGDIKSSTETLEFEMLIRTNLRKDLETLSFQLNHIRKGREEMLRITVSANTQVVITANTSVREQKR